MKRRRRARVDEEAGMRRGKGERVTWRKKDKEERWSAERQEEI